MFAVLFMLLSFYLAIKVSLTEAYRRLSKVREAWKRLVKQQKIEAMPKRESSGATRRTGAINGMVAFQSAEPRKYTKKELSLPFMDTGNWFQNEKEHLARSATNVHDSFRAPGENTVNMLKVPTQNRNSSIFSRLFYQVSLILCRNSSVCYTDVSEKVLSSERVKTAIKTSVMEDLKGQDTVDSGIIAAQLVHKQRA
ncbi:hypothetical protein X975_26097, partial [Stegodyphus mimosarum]